MQIRGVQKYSINDKTKYCMKSCQEFENIVKNVFIFFVLPSNVVQLQRLTPKRGEKQNRKWGCGWGFSLCHIQEEEEEEGDKDEVLNQNKQDGAAALPPIFFHENSSLIHPVPIDYAEIFNFYLHWLLKRQYFFSVPILYMYHLKINLLFVRFHVVLFFLLFNLICAQFHRSCKHRY